MAGPCCVPKPITAQSASPARVTSLAPQPVPGWPCPESPQEMAAALRVGVLWWEISPLHLSGGSSPPGAAMGSRYSQGLAEVAAQAVQPSPRAWVPQHGAVQQGCIPAGCTITASPRQEEGSAAEEGELCLPQVPVPRPTGCALPLQSLTPRTKTCPRSPAPATRSSRHSSSIFIYPRMRPLTHN